MAHGAPWAFPPAPTKTAVCNKKRELDSATIIGDDCQIMSHDKAKARVAILFFFIVAAILVSSGIVSGQASFSAVSFPVYASPAALSAASTAYLAQDAEACVVTTGCYTYQSSCTCTIGGVTCLSAAGADGGAGCWLANPVGVVGANYVTQWYVDSVNGNDGNACLTSGAGACQDLAEVLRRIGDQYLYTQVNINLSGSFANNSYLIRTRGVPGSNYVFGGISINGTRTCAGSYTLTHYTPWNGSAHQEGTAYVSGLDAGALSTANGYILQDNTGPNAGLGILVGPQIDAGTFLTPGGSIPGSYVQGEPTTGDNVSVCTLTQLSTTAATSLVVLDGYTTFNNVEIGNYPNSVEIAGNAAYDFETVFQSSIIAGSQTQDGASAVESYGSAWVGYGGYGRLDSWGGLFDNVFAQDHGLVELTFNNIVGMTLGGGYIHVGSRDGRGTFEISGPVSILSGTHPCIMLDGSSAAIIVDTGSYGWCHGYGSTQYAVQAYSGSLLTYPSTNPLVLTGTQAYSPYSIGGSIFDGGGAAGSLPQYNIANGAGIVVHQ